MNLSLFGVRNKAVSIYLGVGLYMIFNFIHKTINKLTLKRKTAKALINAKKGDNTALPCLRETR